MTVVLGTVALGTAGALVAWLIQRAPEAAPHPGFRTNITRNAPAPAPASSPTADVILVDAPLAPSARADLVMSADPSSPSSDPVPVRLVTESTQLELFQLEPRDPAFAGPREQALRDRLTERLRKRIAYDVRVEVSCRTSCCELTLEGGANWDEVNAAVYASEQEQLVETVTSSPLYDEQGVVRLGVSMILGFTAAQRDHEAYERVLAKHRAHDDDVP